MKKGILAVGGILLAAGIAGGAFWYFRGRTGQIDDGKKVYVSSVATLTGASSGVMNRYAGVVEPQETVKVKIESGRKVKEVQVKTGDEVKQGQLLFEYDLSSIQEDLQEEKLNLDRLKNEAMSLTEQIATLEKEKKTASQDNQLSYTIEIETNRMNLKKNEYDQKTKAAQIQKLQNAMGNTEVRSEIEGIIQKIDTTKLSTDDGDSLDEGSSVDDFSMDSSSNDFITILSTGAYRIKGTVNEQNKNSIIPGEPVIVHSRVDENQIWRGTMGAVDTENANSDSGDDESYMFGMASSDSQTSSSTYPFYVELDSSEGLMLGQHVYIEPDNGQADKKEGLWLSEFYIADADTDNPFVWAADDKKRLEKRSVTLGQYDAELCEYEILDGLTVKDCIAYPDEELQEGAKTSTSLSVLEEDSEDLGADELGDEDWSEMSEDGEDMMDSMEEFEDGEFSEDEILDEEEIPEEEFFGEEEILEDDFLDEEFYEDDLVSMDEDTVTDSDSEVVE